jgi:hypothetical protein
MPIIAGRASAAYGAGFGAVTTIPYAGPFGAYDALANSTVGSTAVSGITFAGIPTGYKHLQIRYIIKSTNSGTADNPLNMQFNADSNTSNYKTHRLYGNGTSAASDNYSLAIAGSGVDNNNTNTFYAAGVIDVLDYANVSKYKTVRSLSGWDSNGSGIVWGISELWLNTSAISSLTFSYFSGGNFGQYSQIALYGVE